MAIEVGADTFPKLLLHNSEQRGERPAFREKSRGIWHTTTWRELAAEVATLATALSARGLQRGAHVAFVGDNRPRLYAGMAAAQGLGAIAVPLYQDATGEEMAAPIQNAGITHIFAENQEQVDKLLGILPRCPSVQCIVYDADRGMRHYKQPQLVSYTDLLQQGREIAASKPDFFRSEAARGSGQDAAFLFLTSGTTGPAKGVVLTYAALIDRARVVAAAEGLTDTDVAMAYLSPGWIGQILFGYVQPMLVGYCVCCPESSETMLADMREMAPTYFLATPRVLETLLTQVEMRVEDAGGFNRALYRQSIAAGERTGARVMSGGQASLGDRIASSLYNILIYGPLRDVLGMSKIRTAFTAGDAISPEMHSYFRALGINLKQLYGSTETGFYVAMQGNGMVKPSTVGAVAEGVEVKISPTREILVRSPGMFKEYHGDPSATAKALTDGWFQTGDAGYIGDDGHLRIIDRMQNVGALSDGSTFSPRFIENKLKFTPYIKEAVVFGDKRDRVCALIDVDISAVGRWADKQFISYTGYSDLASRDEVYGLIADGISGVNAELARNPEHAKSQVHRFVILPKELDADDGVLTRTGKLRRSVIAERFKALIDGMYAGRTEVRFDTDGSHAGAGPADLKIRDAKVVAGTSAKRAA